MRAAHLLCDDGITAELLLGALVDAGAPVEEMQASITSAGVAAELRADTVRIREVTATSLRVDSDPDPAARVDTLEGMETVIAGAELPPRAAERARIIVHALLRAEAAVHGLPVEHVHLHELGRPRSIARILAGVTALETLAIDQLSVSTVALGGGSIDIAHGRFPVPPPVVLNLLAGFAVRGDERPVELTTPSGAAVLAGLARSTTAIPGMRLEAHGRGALIDHLGDRLLTVLIGTLLPESAM